MAERTAQSWLILRPSGTPASPAPGNTCGCPSLVVRDGPDVTDSDRHGLLHHVKKKTKKQNKKTFIFSSVPRYLLEDVGRGSTDPFLISDFTHGESKAEEGLQVFVACCRLWLASELRPLSPAGGWYTGPTYRPQNVLLTNSLEIIEKILGMCTDACRAQGGMCRSYHWWSYLKGHSGVFICKRSYMLKQVCVAFASFCTNWAD